MKRTLLIILALVLCGGVFALFWTPARSAFLPKEPQDLRPVFQDQQEGWQVCAVGSIEPIPGVGDRQVFELCHSDGWRIKTYCLDPGQPLPELGAVCSQTSPGVFWCGVGVQMLQQFEILETPGPGEIPTPTRTPTQTPLPTNTATPRPTATATAQPTRTTQPQLEDTPTPTSPAAATATSYIRPQPGGPGNLEVGGILLAAFALAIWSGWWFWHKITGQARQGE